MTVYLVIIRGCNCGSMLTIEDQTLVYKKKSDAVAVHAAITKQLLMVSEHGDTHVTLSEAKVETTPVGPMYPWVELEKE